MQRQTFQSIPTSSLSQPISATSKITSACYGARQVDGILGDLGVSPHQFDIGERGFSIRFDGPLDMRMNPSSGISARGSIRNLYEQQALYDLFRKHTDIKGLRSLINALLLARATKPLSYDS
jgi:16S rRNA (cytosine1402-N4)-methyltransferase